MCYHPNSNPHDMLIYTLNKMKETVQEVCPTNIGQSKILSLASLYLKSLERGPLII